jgi:TfoX/Sxy family transcriptional regulator of competence genes
MAYDPKLAERIRSVLAGRKDVVEKKMFGGIAFMVSGSMACGPHGRNLIVRIGEDAAVEALRLPHVKPMDFTGKVLKNFATIEPAAIRTDAQLRHWVGMSAAYAASSASKKNAPSKASRRGQKRRSRNRV